MRGRQAIQGAYLIDINAMVFGMPRALFPALATTLFGGGAATLGFLYAAPGAGALVGALTTGWVSRSNPGSKNGLTALVRLSEPASSRGVRAIAPKSAIYYRGKTQITMISESSFDILAIWSREYVPNVAAVTNLQAGICAVRHATHEIGAPAAKRSKDDRLPAPDAGRSSAHQTVTGEAGEPAIRPDTSWSGRLAIRGLAKVSTSSNTSSSWNRSLAVIFWLRRPSITATACAKTTGRKISNSGHGLSRPGSE